MPEAVGRDPPHCCEFGANPNRRPGRIVTGAGFDERLAPLSGRDEGGDRRCETVRGWLFNCGTTSQHLADVVND
jgi:hypothetical protein